VSFLIHSMFDSFQRNADSFGLTTARIYFPPPLR
jgi:hypothetical protein